MFALLFFLAINSTNLKLVNFLNMYRERFESLDKEFIWHKKMSLSSQNSMGENQDP
jgi:hypothetical protein